MTAKRPVAKPADRVTLTEVLACLERIEGLLGSQSDKPLSAPEAAEYCGVSERTLTEWTSNGLIACARPTAKQKYYDRSDLRAFMLSGRRKIRDEIEQQAIERIAGNGGNGR